MNADQGLAKDPLDDIEALYRTRHARFLRLAAAIVGDSDGARDVVQDAFASAIHHRHEYRGTGSLEGWVWRTVRNAALNHRRRHAGRVRANGGSPDSGGTKPLDDDVVRALVLALPERQRQVLFLRYYADLDYRMIAEVLNVRPGTVAASLNAAHASLRAGLPEGHR